LSQVIVSHYMKDIVGLDKLMSKYSVRSLLISAKKINKICRNILVDTTKERESKMNILPKF